MKVRGQTVRVLLWDTAGQERFRTLTSGSYRNVQGVFVVYAVDDPDTFQNVEQWLGEVKRYAQNDNVVRILLGNKTDLAERKVATADARAFAESKDMPFFETSALDGSQCAEALDTIVNKIFQVENPQTESEKKGCCVIL